MTSLQERRPVSALPGFLRQDETADHSGTDHRHGRVFEITPELNVGFVSNTVEVGMDELEQSGFHLDIGARAGGEIHFGFIDVPEVALQAGVGLRYAMDSTSAEIDSDNNASATTSSFGTTVGDNPWSIFFANIAALYYFDR